MVESAGSCGKVIFSTVDQPGAGSASENIYTRGIGSARGRRWCGERPNEERSLTFWGHELIKYAVTVCARCLSRLPPGKVIYPRSALSVSLILAPPESGDKINYDTELHMGRRLCRARQRSWCHMAFGHIYKSSRNANKTALSRMLVISVPCCCFLHYIVSNYHF